MRVILTGFGTSGDVAPLLAMAEALRTQGHAPLLLLNPLYQEVAAARDLPFVAVGARWESEAVGNVGKYLRPFTGPVAIWQDFYLPNVVPTFQAVRQAIRDHRADAVVGHWMSFGSHFAARQAGVRNLVVTLAPCWWYSGADPSIYSPWQGPVWLLRAGMGLPRFLVNRIIGRPLRAIAAELGLSWRRDEYFAVLREAQGNLGLWSPALRAAAADDPPRATICGFPFDDSDPTPLGAELERFLDAGPPPLVVGLGSALTRTGQKLYRAIGLACRALDCRAVLVGASPEVAQGLDGVTTVASAPYRRLFPRARAIVHHGGIGTLAEAMRAGKPMAVVPFANDQYDNARRAHRQGGALRWARSALRGKRLHHALEALLADQALAHRAAALGEQVRAEPGGATVGASIVLHGTTTQAREGA